MTKIFVLLLGQVSKAKDEFIHHLGKVNEVHNKHDCDVSLVFCPIVTRVGTDITAAVKDIKKLTDNRKPGLLVVLHPTSDPNCVVKTPLPDDLTNFMIVDCLFNDDGLLRCSKNNEALNIVKMEIRDTPTRTDCVPPQCCPTQ